MPKLTIATLQALNQWLEHIDDTVIAWAAVSLAVDIAVCGSTGSEDGDSCHLTIHEVNPWLEHELIMENNPTHRLVRMVQWFSMSLSGLFPKLFRLRGGTVMVEGSNPSANYDFCVCRHAFPF